MRDLLRAAPPPVLPPQLNPAERIEILHAALGWTPCQAKVVLAGAEVATYRDIGVRLGMKERTVRAHICLLASRHGGANQAMLTALAIASIWRSVGTEQSDASRGGSV